MSACRGICRLDNGNWEGAFGKYGLLRLRSISGNMNVVSPWNTDTAAYDEVTFIFSGDGNMYEAAIFEDMTEFKKLPEEFVSFEQVVQQNKDSFAQFKKRYRSVPEEYKETANYAMWLLWTYRCKATGGIREPMIFMHLQ